MWDRRYREINDWERYLFDNGFTVVKLFLNLSKEEQRIRFLKRLDRPEKNWKFSAADVRERRRWDDYQQAFSEMLSHTSTDVGAVVRDPRGPQVVRADLRRRGHRPHADRDRSAVSGGRARNGRRGSGGDAKRELEAQAPHGAAPDPYAAAHAAADEGAGNKDRRSRSRTKDEAAKVNPKAKGTRA